MSIWLCPEHGMTGGNFCCGKAERWEPTKIPLSSNIVDIPVEEYTFTKEELKVLAKYFMEEAGFLRYDNYELHELVNKIIKNGMDR